MQLADLPSEAQQALGALNTSPLRFLSDEQNILLQLLAEIPLFPEQPKQYATVLIQTLRPEKLTALNPKFIKRLIELNSSQFFEKSAQYYFDQSQPALGLSQTNLALQGIADLFERAPEDTKSSLATQTIANLSAPKLQALPETCRQELIKFNLGGYQKKMIDYIVTITTTPIGDTIKLVDDILDANIPGLADLLRETLPPNAQRAFPKLRAIPAAQAACPRRDGHPGGEPRPDQARL